MLTEMENGLLAVLVGKSATVLKHLLGSGKDKTSLVNKNAMVGGERESGAMTTQAILAT